ncbi:type III restriction-modification system endonuclease [Moorella sp. Hama-1]|uniref:type III restriction-modification system endonuclease n=1 Tax=Moorella sp. Hama-1 TaxID=2138101 RepID=UPI000D653518|nr:DEAD/DEAH box helicase family protein [Moorella sp. Hama-1]BCV20945.1 type III restriction endonuclease subunit R [Moorella sp. Hama-1]
MKLKFKIQQFQTDAVNAAVDCFAGQPNEQSLFTLDMGQLKSGPQMGISYEVTGFRNRPIELTPEEVFDNIRKVQARDGLKISPKLEGKYNLTVEMETGTGKTYVYIKTMFELFKKYGWGKYIVVVPSIAIREGVKKSFEITEEHFMEQYGRKARYFIYNSRQLHKIDQFASDPGINVMIINTQAFNARGKDARRIYMELDEFQSRMPIDVIAQANPILIIDEPQSVEGEKTVEALKLFKPLFTVRYSATHRHEYNKVYRLDALDAYNKKLVKKINVKGITVKGTTGTDGYLYLGEINVSQKHYPLARLEFERKTRSGIRRELRRVSINDNLYELSGGLEQYRGYIVSEINGAKNTIEFANGVSLSAGDVQGDVNELTLRRIQIRETIKSHLEKERNLFYRGIKVLSLFFIDEVAKYRQYDKNGNKRNGEYARIFEEEYRMLVEEYLRNTDDQDRYANYLRQIDVEKTHNGYFAIDKQGRMTNPKVKARETDSEDEDAYNLIMKDKEGLLSFSEPTRFIFSHSALKEGWDNPNVFQICTLKHSDSTIKKRQEVGRGLRLCVNQDGERIDDSVPGIDVHEVNVLSVVASESYETFARELQKEIAETLSDRPHKVDIQFFLDKVLTNEREEEIRIDERLARKLYQTFVRNNYIDEEDNLTEGYHQAAEKGEITLPEELKEHQQAVIDLVSTVYSETDSRLVHNERNKNVELKLNDNFYKEEFQKLWQKINVKTAYIVKFETEELVERCINALDTRLRIADISYQIKDGVLETIDSKEQLEKGEGFVVREAETGKVHGEVTSGVRYDLAGKLMSETGLTRKTIVKILTGVKQETFDLFKKNPEEFIIKAARIINEEKATTIIERTTYDPTNETYNTDIFTQNTLKGMLGDNALPVSKHVYNYVITDSNTEKKFARDLDTSKEVCVYAKLPRGFFIPTPVGNYNPDWAIVFEENKVKHVYFIAETKGSMASLELRKIEEAKIYCARKHFEKISNNSVKYDVVENYEKLLEIVR